jgi:signal transduction histidine kinase
MIDKSSVLIVEDELISAYNLADNLNDLGYRVSDIVHSGEAAIDLIEHLAPDLVIMDIELSGTLSGIEAANILKDRHVPVVFLTSFADSLVLSRAMQSQPYGYLIKPAKLEDVQATLEVAIARTAQDKHIRHVTDEERHLNQLKSHFYTMLAHDLRTPLSIMLASLELVREYGEKLTEARKQQHFVQMRASIREMTQQLESLMAAEQIAHHGLPYNPEWVDIVAYSRKRLSVFRDILQENQTLNFTCPPVKHQIWADTTLLGHILNNLLSNAIKYSPADGHIEVDLMINEQDICWIIADNGIGMPESFRKKLFTPFERASNVGAVKGTGMGLYIVGQAVERHQGSIEVTSQLNGGTTFTVRLPKMQ